MTVTTTLKVSQDQIEELHSTLTNRSGKVPLSSRFRALFTLKAIGSSRAVESIVEALRPNRTREGGKIELPQALLGHELAYCLGQIGDPDAIPVLEETLKDRSVHPMVRHEAAEAMGAIGDKSCLPILREYLNDPEVSVRETCELAIGKIEDSWSSSSEDPKCSSDGVRVGEYGTVDPTPSMIKSFHESDGPISEVEVLKMKERLLDTESSLFERYRAMFGLRDAVGRSTGSDEGLAVAAVEALADGFDDKSALFRHEIAYVFGQLSHPASVPSLLKVLKNKDEEEMVRHEAAEALGSIASPEVFETLKIFGSFDEPSQVVRESCEVALDMYKYEQSKDFQYTLPLEISK